MNEEKHAVEQGFYQRCAELLGASHTYKPWVHHKITRWNNRTPGNGRFPGFGTIKMFGPALIHVSLRHPRVLNRMCRSQDEVFALLGKTP